nr:IS110 family transposase [Ensifer sp. IC4062]
MLKHLRGSHPPNNALCSHQGGDAAGGLVIHRVREMLIRQRTQLINGIRGHLAEFGIIGPDRSHKIGLLTTLIEDPNCDELPAVARHALQYLVNQLREISAKLFKIGRDLIAVARNSNACRRLMSIPGVGVITATALVSSMREPTDFKSGRHFAAWLGLVPKQRSSGGRARLFGISKRGDRYLRTLMIPGARAALSRAGGKQDPRSLWLGKMRQRRHPNVAAVALANKNARIVWAMLSGDTAYEPALSVKAA